MRGVGGGEVVDEMGLQTGVGGWPRMIATPEDVEHYPDERNTRSFMFVSYVTSFVIQNVKSHVECDAC